VRSHRPPGRGHVYRRGRIWWLSYWVDGQQRRESSASTSRSDAVALLSERVALLKPIAGTSLTLLSDLLRALIADYEINRRKSSDRLRIICAHLRDHYGDPLARAIDGAAIVGYAQARAAAGAGSGTINLELGALRRAFRLGLDLGKVARLPKFRMLKPPPARSGFVEDGDLAKILAALPPAIRPVVEVAAITGWRLKSEILTREWKHVDLINGWLRIDPGEAKTGEGRNFPLTATLRALFEALRVATAVPFGRVFRRSSGRPVRSIRQPWLRAVQVAGCPSLRPHDLRRTAVRNLERAGVPRSTAMRLVGHRTEAMYIRYAITDEVMLREAAEKMEHASRSRSLHIAPAPTTDHTITPGQPGMEEKHAD